MENQLTETQQGLVSLVDSHDLGDIIKPLVKDIHLFDSYIAGTTHLKDASVLDVIQVGDVLKLQREDNRFDSNAILVLHTDGRKLGYVPEKDNIVFARLMDAGKLLKAKITEVEPKGIFTMIHIGIYLVDY